MQKIANINNKFNIEIYYKLKNKFGNVKKIYENFKDDDIDKSIIKLLTDDNIKEEVIKSYKELIKRNVEIITLEDNKYPKKLKECNNLNIPFCILKYGNIDLNNKTIYIYYEEYFTNFARRVISYFSKIAKEEKCNVISEYSDEKNKNINIKVKDLFNIKEEITENTIIFPSIVSYYNYMLSCINLLIIIEARYEEKIVTLVNNFLDNGKEVYAVPSNIFRKNSYFSNYLIKQGSEVILNKQDLKYIVNNIIY